MPQVYILPGLHGLWVYPKGTVRTRSLLMMSPHSTPWSLQRDTSCSRSLDTAGFGISALTFPSVLPKS